MLKPAALGLLRNPVRGYDWGSSTAIPQLLGRAPTGAPQAELWLGAHPDDPSVLAASGVRLDEHLAAYPQQLGSGGGSLPALPFLMKLLAAQHPLSLQVHPTRAQAQAGYDREQAAGIALDDPRRSYRDREHKPEIIIAISPFQALSGFRAPAAALDDLAELLGEQLAAGIGAELAAALSRPDQSEALRSGFELISGGGEPIRELVRVAEARAAQLTSPAADSIVRAWRTFGDDPGVLATALLNRVDLAPGEALYLDAGQVHAYLSGLGVEAMAASDNVLRAGLTSKLVDVPEMLAIVDFTPHSPYRVQPESSSSGGFTMDSYWPPAAEFSVHLLQAEPGAARTFPQLTGPSVLILVQGRLWASSAGTELELGRGDSLFQAAGAPLSLRAGDEPTVGYLTTLGATA